MTEMASCSGTVTADLCKDAMQRNIAFIFLPEDAEDSKRIQQGFFNLGFAWASGEKKPLYLNDARKCGILFSRGQLTKTPSRGYEGDNVILWQKPSFGRDVLSKDLFVDKIVTFHPATPQEAGDIQEKLFSLGLAWQTGDQKISLQNELSRGTLYVRNGVLSYDSTRSGHEYLLDLNGRKITDLTAADMSSTFGAAAAQKAPIPMTMAERLLKMEERLSELEKENAALRAKLDPDVIEKVVRLPVPAARKKNESGGS